MVRTPNHALRVGPAPKRAVRPVLNFRTTNWDCELGIEVIESSSRFAKMFEPRVIQEMFRLNDYGNLDLKFWYWQTNSDVEVDVIISRGAGRPLAAIEIKSTGNPAETALSGLRGFAQDYPNVPQYCVWQAGKLLSFCHYGEDFIGP